MTDAPPVRLMILFPYSAKSPEVFEKLAVVLKDARAARHLHTSGEPPLLVINKDSLEGYEKFRQSHPELEGTYLPHFVWAVDTCQMWLSGWGRILDENHDPDRKSPPDLGILQVPGDLTEIRSKDPREREPLTEFLGRLKAMRQRLQDADFVLGDFEVAPEQAKQLIDTYGTFPLLYNWFPQVARELRRRHIDRPRSEFLAVSTKFLESFTKTGFRKFAYEQTLVLLIHAIRDRGWEIAREAIGIIGDYGGDRGFREATDQIERTERVLKLLWRESKGMGEKNLNFPVREFEYRDARSTAIRRNAMICCQNFLDPTGSDDGSGN